MRGLQRAALAAIALVLVSCATRPPESGSPPLTHPAPAPVIKDGPPHPRDIPDDIENTPDAIPVPESPSAYGNPRSYSVFGKTYYVLASADGFRQRGGASWYGRKFHGRRTSSGEIYDMFKMTAAHKTLPIPCYLRVTNLANNKTVIVRVNDRGPFHEGRVIDLSYAAAAKLDLLGAVGEVEIEVVTAGATPTPTPGRVASAADGVHYLQVAAFSNPANARSMRETLGQIGITHIDVREAQLDGRTLHRVVIGPFTDMVAMGATQERLAANGLQSYPVID